MGTTPRQEQLEAWRSPRHHQVAREQAREVVETAEQITLDGDSVPATQVLTRRKAGPPLNGQQRAILELAKRPQGVRPVEAGLIVHAERPACAEVQRGERAPGDVGKAPSAAGTRFKGKGKSCCAWTSSDGVEACKRLVKRGLLTRRAGKWGGTYHAIVEQP
jgi:hypothetical protein